VRGLATERQEQIAAQLREHGFVRNSELSDLLGVSIVTVRQDIEALQNRGVARKTFGGAVLKGESGLDSAFAQRVAQYREEKRRIGAAAAQLVQPGETILLDAGSTTIEMARRLPEHADITVVTCALNVALEAGTRAGVHVVVCGGELNPRTMSVVGPEVERMLGEVHADRLFLATYGVDLVKGLAERNFAGVQVKRALIAAARQVVLICDSSKFGTCAPVRFAPVNVLHRVITDPGIPKAFRRQFQDQQITLDVV
jgi:DeoR/GlpR family transcriptional regulator of sugar metabolism